jgi:hypothetical protein
VIPLQSGQQPQSQSQLQQSVQSGQPHSGHVQSVQQSHFGHSQSAQSAQQSAHRTSGQAALQPQHGSPLHAQHTTIFAISAAFSQFSPHNSVQLPQPHSHLHNSLQSGKQSQISPHCGHPRISGWRKNAYALQRHVSAPSVKPNTHRAKTNCQPAD